MDAVTWHVWQANDPGRGGRLVQFCDVESGAARPSGRPWTDAVVAADYGDLLLLHVGTLQGPPKPLDDESSLQLVDLLATLFPDGVTGIDGVGVTMTFALPQNA